LVDKKENTWEGSPGAYQDEGFQKLWRTHSDAVNRALLTRWLGSGQMKNLLKTDLFDEAVSDGLSPFLGVRSKRVFYIDVSFEVHQRAKRRYPNLRTIRTDVRFLPFADGMFDGIVSNSTLDHFKSLDDLVVSLRELHRVLRPGGQLFLTLDNLANPVVLLRNILPFRLLHHLRIVPYFVGVTLGPDRSQQLMKKIGFNVLEVDAMMHCPRVLAVAVARWMERHASPRTEGAFLRFLMAFEHLSRLPTRFLTGYFIAIRAVKCRNLLDIDNQLL
jgi:SAM-dependent methyltransferase